MATSFRPLPHENVMIEGDRQILTAAVGNLLQNAFKFTRPHTDVTLRVDAGAERVLIEVQDECGGLPGASVEELFRPFEQRSVNRTGLGLGLAFSRWAVEANHGRILRAQGAWAWLRLHHRSAAARDSGRCHRGVVIAVARVRHTLEEDVTGAREFTTPHPSNTGADFFSSTRGTVHRHAHPRHT